MASGRADRHGNLTLSIRVDDVLSPTAATLTVTAKDGLVTATRDDLRDHPSARYIAHVDA